MPKPTKYNINFSEMELIFTLRNRFYHLHARHLMMTLAHAESNVGPNYSNLFLFLIFPFSCFHNSTTATTKQCLLFFIWACPSCVGSGYSLQVLVPTPTILLGGLWAFHCYPSRIMKNCPKTRSPLFQSAKS